MNPTVGGFARVGAGTWVSNAKTVDDLRNRVRTVGANAAWGIQWGRFFHSWGNGKWQLGVSPPTWGVGKGLNCSPQDTTTIGIGLKEAVDGRIK